MRIFPKLSALPLILLAACSSGGGSDHVLVLDDFESESSLERWTGPIALSGEYPAHGAQGLALDLADRRARRLESTLLPADWSGYDLLRFDIYNPTDRIVIGTLELIDQQGLNPDGQELTGRTYRGPRIFMNRGWNHYDFKLQAARVEDGDSLLVLAAIRRFRLDFGQIDGTLYLDNFRLVRGEEGAATISRADPRDCRVLIEDRNATLEQYGPPEAIVPSQELEERRGAARAAVRRLEEQVEKAQAAGLNPLYWRVPLVTARIGLETRSQLVWFQGEREETAILDYVISSCNQAAEELAAISAVPPATESTDPRDQALLRKLAIPAYPSFKGLPQRDGFFRYPNGDPVFLLAMHGMEQGELLDFFATYNHVRETFTVGGGSRYDIEDSPVYEAFHKYPDTHRVGWDGWCGHLIKDRWSMGGRKENVVICLESPQIRAAILQYMQTAHESWSKMPDLLYNIMGYELMYLCYCETSQQMFREYLQGVHGSLAKVNEVWGTSFASFDEIRAPECRDAAPLPDVNRAAWYDWACFNTRRFTDYLKWVKSEMRQLDPVVPINAGGTSSMLSSANGTSGIDEEQIINEVDDVILNESGGTNIFSDLFLSLSDSKKVMVEPEMGGEVQNLLLHFLHGKTAIAKWLWGVSRGTSEYPSFYGTAVTTSWDFTLPEVAEVLKIALDIRTLGRETAAFIGPEPEIAILYSKSCMVQVPPQLHRAGSTPYLEALGSLWEGSRYLGARVGFVSERQVLAGKLSRFKLLLVPAAKYLPPEVTDRIYRFAEQGGRVLVVPESFLFDQYARENDRVAELGIKVRDVTLPEVLGRGETVQNYDMSISQTIVYGKVERQATTTGAGLFAGGAVTLRTSGLVQQLDPGPGLVLAKFEDGSPALVQVAKGKGQLYYLAAPLAAMDYHQLLEPITRELGLAGPLVGLDDQGKLITGAEVRSVDYEGAWLVYASNLTDQPVSFTLTAQRGSPGAVRDLRSLELLPGARIELAPRQETIFRVEKK